MVFDLGYNYAVRGEVVRHSGDTRFITTMAFYTADRGDSRYIEDDDVREIFLKIYDSCDEKGLLKSSAGDGWVNRISHLIDSYDGIQLYVMWPAIYEAVENNCQCDGAALDKRVDDIMDIINHSIIPRNFLELFNVFADNFVLGLVMTVSHRRYSMLRWYSLIVYL